MSIQMAIAMCPACGRPQPPDPRLCHCGHSRQLHDITAKKFTRCSYYSRGGRCACTSYREAP